ncbi:MAG: hypothetical protein ACRCZC_07925, partial [Culicoidibacterales bacterium]
MKEILLHYFVLFLLPYCLFRSSRQQNGQKAANIVIAGFFLSGMILSFAILWDTLDFNITIVIFFLLIVLFYRGLIQSQKQVVLEVLRMIYFSVLVALTVTAGYEIIVNQTMHILLEKNYYFHAVIIYGLIIAGFLGIEAVFTKAVTMDVFTFFFSKTKMWHVLLILNILLVKSTALLIILNKSNHSLVITYLFLVTTVIEIFFCFMTINYIARMYLFSVFRYRHELLNEMYELQLSHLEQLELKAREIRRLSHDIHNHKIVLYKLVSEQAYDQALAYLDSLSNNEVQMLAENTITEQRIINTLCQQKQEICRK